jgi:hypothetical protein
MRVQVASGLFRLWVVISIMWLAVAGAYVVVSYQNVEQHDLTKRGMFDDLTPGYEHCWRSSYGKKVESTDSISIEDLTRIAECERTVDQGQILKTGIPVALGIPIIVLVLGWGLVWAFRGFLPRAAK